MAYSNTQLIPFLPLGQSVFERPFFQSLLQGRWTNPNFFRPIVKNLRFSIKCYNPISAVISCLHVSIFPLTVVWRIAKQVVFSTYSKISNWTLAHVSQKVFKILPSFTNFNAFSSIMFIRNMIRVFTTLNHACPNGIFYRVRAVMFCLSLCHHFSVETATAFSVSRKEGVGKNDFLFPTRARTLPMNPTKQNGRFCCQSPELSFAQIPYHTCNILSFFLICNHVI